MASLEVMTKLSQTNQTKRVIIIPYSGLTTSPAASFKPWIGLIHAAEMGSSSTQKNLPLVPTQSPLLTLRSHQITFDHVNSTWMPSAIFPDHKTSQTCGPGLASSIKFHTLSLLLNTCSLSARLSNLAQHLFGLTN